MDDPDEMFQLADLLEGVSVDCAELSPETHSPGINNLLVTYRILRKHPPNTNKIVYILKLCCLALQKTKCVPQIVLRISGNYVTRIC